jgi:hypothetical protein
VGGFMSNAKSWLSQESKRLDRVESIMAGVILVRAQLLAPKESGELRGNGRVERNQNGGRSIVFGDSSVPYARRRHFENKKNPQTLQYLKRAGESVAKENIKKYVDMTR